MMKILFLLAYVGYGTAYPGGAPQSACENMKPLHRSFVAQTGASPFKISAPVEKCKKEITVTLTGSTDFSGFLCQARLSISGTKTSGQFTPLGNTSLVKNKCPSMTSLTHSSKDLKNSIQFTWSPANDESVYIVCSFVQQFDKFWMMQSSDLIALNLKDPSCSSSAAGLSVLAQSAIVLLAMTVKLVIGDN